MFWSSYSAKLIKFEWAVFLPVADGKLYTWGSSSEGQTGQGGEDCNVPTHVQIKGKVVAVGCGYYHMAVVTSKS